MNFSIVHTDCPAKNAYDRVMEDITRLPQYTEQPFRVFRCPACKLEIRVGICGAKS